MSPSNITYDSNTVPLIFNITYDNNTIPLVFNTNEQLSWMGYSLDGQANQTINGNSTLTNLAEGNHSLTVYVNDTFGHMGKSDAVFFDVSLPVQTPSPTPSPNLTETLSPSSTHQPTLEPSPTSQTNFYSDWIPYAIIGIIILVAIGTAVYLKRRKREL
jgi:hypothetical protein